MNDTIISDDVVPPGKPWAREIKNGQRLRIVDLEGQQGVDFLCYNAERPEERYHAPNTIKAAHTLKLTKGHILYSDEARAIFTIVEDTCDGHDTIAGCCSAPSNAMLYEVEHCPGCRENFLTALGTYGLGRKDIVPNINFFCSVPVSTNQSLQPAVFTEGTSKPGDYIELQANMNALAVISNCPQVNNPCNSGKPSPIRITVLKNEQ
ncbi:MAG: DUF1989 domain-containing protein [Gammaproteobacteria bacterium]|nr:DUF1989 domain-containing protein [Gammaproteobacteria bacterium]